MSCLFDSIGHLLNKPSAEVRAQVVDYLQQHKTTEINGLPLVDWITPVEGDFDAYAAAMRLSSTWGTAVEITAAVMLYGRSVLVRMPCGKQWIEIADENSRANGEALCLGYNGSHYVALGIEDSS